MKFSEFKYERPNLDQYVTEVKLILENIGGDHDLQTELKALKHLINLEMFFKLKLPLHLFVIVLTPRMNFTMQK